MVDGASVGRATPFSRHVGTLAQWNGMYLTADVIDQGRRIVLAMHAQPADERFERNSHGMWKYEIPFEEATEVMELDIETVWNGLELRIVDEFTENRRHQAVPRFLRRPQRRPRRGPATGQSGCRGLRSHRSQQQPDPQPHHPADPAVLGGVT
jgi:hypothetical protein